MIGTCHYWLTLPTRTELKIFCPVRVGRATEMTGTYHCAGSLYTKSSFAVEKAEAVVPTQVEQLNSATIELSIALIE